MPVAILKDAVFERAGYSPHRGQKKIHKSKARHRIGSMGRRLGKSTAGGHELVPEALATYRMRRRLEDQAIRREFWIVGPEYSDAEKEFRVFWNDCKRMGFPLDKPGSYYNAEGGDMVVSMWDGLFLVHGKSAKYPSTLVGEGLSGVVLGEAAKLKQVVWNKYLRPALADFRGWSLMLSTPEGKNWFYEMWQRGQDPRFPAYESWRMPSWINDIIFPKGADNIKALKEIVYNNIPVTPELIADLGVDPEIVDMMVDMTQERFAQEVEAKFTEFVGRVFKDFDEEIHVRDIAYDPRYPIHIACDYGWTNPFVALALQVDAWDNVFVLEEYRCTERDINEIAADLYARPLFRNAVELYPDPAEPGDTAVLVKKLKLKSKGGTGGELTDRLKLIRRALKLVPEHVPWEQREPKLFIARGRCPDLVREMDAYRYPDRKAETVGDETKNAPELPLKKDDHGPEALGRFYIGKYGPPARTDGRRARVKKANIAA